MGTEICKKFASEGASVVLVDLWEEGLNKNYEALTKDYGPKHMLACGDVSDSNFIKNVFAYLEVCFITFKFKEIVKKST